MDTSASSPTEEPERRSSAAHWRRAEQRPVLLALLALLALLRPALRRARALARAPPTQQLRLQLRRAGARKRAACASGRLGRGRVLGASTCASGRLAAGRRGGGVGRAGGRRLRARARRWPLPVFLLERAHLRERRRAADEEVRLHRLRGMLALGRDASVGGAARSKEISGSLGQPRPASPQRPRLLSRQLRGRALEDCNLGDCNLGDCILEIVSRASFAVELEYCDAISAASGTCGRGTRRGRVGEGRVLGRVLDTPSAAKSERGARRLAAGVAGAGVGGSAALDASCVA